MTYTIKDLSDLTIKMFLAVGTPEEDQAEKNLETEENKNNTIINDLLNKLFNGVIDAVKATTEGHLYYIYTLSTQAAGAIQKTTFTTDAAGDPLPLSHINIYEKDNYINYEPGYYTTIKY